jgi:hypothetical protein
MNMLIIALIGSSDVANIGIKTLPVAGSVAAAYPNSPLYVRKGVHILACVSKA